MSKKKVNKPFRAEPREVPQDVQEALDELAAVHGRIGAAGLQGRGHPENPRR